MLKGLKTFQYGQLIKTTFMLKRSIRLKTCIWLKKNVFCFKTSQLVHELNQLKIHDIRCQTWFMKHLNERNNLKKLAAQNKANLKLPLLIYKINFKIQET